MIKKLMNNLFFSCQHATELVEKREFVSLSLMEKVRFKGHMLMCRACRSYEKQSALMEKMFHHSFNSTENRQNAPKMDDSAKNKILEKLKKVR